MYLCKNFIALVVFIEKEKINTKITIIEPVGYLEMTQLTKKCELVITDSGGLQKESYFFDKKCLILRDTTEWVELVENNYALLGGFEKENILEKYQRLIVKNVDWNTQLYGNGETAKQIIDKLK